jgi:hypothetical protein
MTTDDRTGRARRRLLAASGPLASLLIIAFAFTMAPGTDVLSEDSAVNLTVLATVAEHRGRAAIIGVLIMLAMMGLLPFVAGLVAAVRERGLARHLGRRQSNEPFARRRPATRWPG